MRVFNEQFYQHHRYGSGSWAGYEDVARAGYLKPKSLQLGFFGREPLHVNNQAPLITVAGARSGKGRDVIAYNVINYPGSMLIHDAKGELAAISLYHQHKIAVAGYCVNPFNLHGLPQHSCNLLDILTPESNSLFADSQALAENIIAHSGEKDSVYFENRAQEWVDKIMVTEVLTAGHVSLPVLYDRLSMIEGNWPRFKTYIQFMGETGNQDIARVGQEILFKCEHAPKEFSAVISTIYNAFKYMADPAIRRFLEGGDFSMNVLCERPSKIYWIIPAEYLSLCAPLTRLAFTAGMLFKQRNLNAPPVVFLVDEAGQLGKFEALVKAFTFGAGSNIRTWAVFQDLGQIKKHYKEAGVTTFLGSAGTRQFFGVRDYDTAKLISDMLGNQTLCYDALLEQREAGHARFHVIRSVLEDSDPVAAAQSARHHRQNTGYQEKQSRPLMHPDEILQMDATRQILMIENRPPVFAHKYPYFEQRNMAGKYLANPYHRPLDAVHIRGCFGRKQAGIINAEPPRKYERWPQFQKGYRHVQGYY